MSPTSESEGLVARVVALADLPFKLFGALSSAVQDRLVAVGLVVPSGLVLGISLSLQADPSGMGTHRQLGLGGCAVLTLTGYPCPMCGMTTTFTHLAHFDFLAGALNQPFGVVLFALTVGAFIVGLMDLVKPARRWKNVIRWADRHELLVAGGLLGGMIAGWAYKVALVRGFLT